MKRNSIALIAGVLTLLATPFSASAQTNIDFSPDNGKCATIGAVTIGSETGVPIVCWRSGGSEMYTRLRSDSSGGGLNRNILARNSNVTGSVTVQFITSNYSTANIDCDCGFGPGSWFLISYNGYYLDAQGLYSTSDYYYGPTGSADTYMHGGGGNDFMSHWSTVGRLYGDGGADTLLSYSTAGSSDSLYGGTESDCLWDFNGSFSTCDCGTGTNDLRHNSHSCSNCDSTTTCCGIC